MPQTEKSQTGSHRQTSHIKPDLDLRVSHRSNVRQFPRKQVGGNDRQPAPVGQGNADTDQHVADEEIQYPHRQRCGQNADPPLVEIQQFSKHKAHHKAEQIRRHKAFPHDHQAQHQQALKQIRPCAKRQPRQYLRKGKRHTGNRGNACSGIEHQHHAKAVDTDCRRQCQFPAKGVQFFCRVLHFLKRLPYEYAQKQYKSLLSF